MFPSWLFFSIFNLDKIWVDINLLQHILNVVTINLNTILCFKRLPKTLFRLRDWDFRAFRLRQTKQQGSGLRAWSSGPWSIDRLRSDLRVREVGWKQSKWPNGSRLDHCWYYQTKSIQSIGTKMVGKVTLVENDLHTWSSRNVSLITSWLERILGIPIIMRTGLRSK